MVLTASLINTQHYKVRFKGKEWHPPLQLGVVAIEKGAFESPLTMVTKLLTYGFVMGLEPLLPYKQGPWWPQQQDPKEAVLRLWPARLQN